MIDLASLACYRTAVAGQRLDYWVTGFGTGGTLKGVGRVLRKERPETKIVLAEPACRTAFTARVWFGRLDTGCYPEAAVHA